MFVQVIRGHTNDEIGLRRQWQRWETELAPHAHGFLGSTAGIAGDGTFIAMVRFVSEEAAHRNACRDAQTRWWHETQRCLGTGVEFHDCLRSDRWNRGGTDDAGFVQVRQGFSNDPARLRDLYVNQQPVRMGPFRPEVIGGLFAWHGDGGFTLSAYLTSERAARSGENLVEFRSFFEDIDAVMRDVTYIDLKEPWLTGGTQDEP